MRITFSLSQPATALRGVLPGCGDPCAPRPRQASDPAPRPGCGPPEVGGPAPTPGGWPADGRGRRVVLCRPTTRSAGLRRMCGPWPAHWHASSGRRSTSFEPSTPRRGGRPATTPVRSGRTCGRSRASTVEAVGTTPGTSGAGPRGLTVSGARRAAIPPLRQAGRHPPPPAGRPPLPRRLRRDPRRRGRRRRDPSRRLSPDRPAPPRPVPPRRGGTRPPRRRRRFATGGTPRRCSACSPWSSGWPGWWPAPISSG